MKNFYTYILKCADNTLYSGYTYNIERRLTAHNAGKAAKYTFGRRPVTLVYLECFDNKSDALKRECAIKRLTRVQKEALIGQYKGFIDQK